MPKISRQIGTTSQILLVHLQHSRTLTGSGITGLAYNSQSLQCYYKRSTASSSVQIPLVNVTTLGTFVSGGFREVDSTNCPGLYELHVPNAALATGADSVSIYVTGYINLVPKVIQIELTGTNNQDSVRGGLTALPNAAPAASGGLPTVDSTNSVKVQSPLKKNTALTGFMFQMYDTSGALKTGLTITGTVSLDGAAFAATTNSASEVANGWYKINLAAADLNGTVIALRFSATGAADTDLTLLTQN